MIYNINKGSALSFKGKNYETKNNSARCNPGNSTSAQKSPDCGRSVCRSSLEHPMISRGTVYRNLKQLAENGNLYSIEIPGCANCYDHRCFDHYHARYINCCKVFDVDMDYVSDLEKRIKNPSDFAFTGYDLIFKGYCHECQEKL